MAVCLEKLSPFLGKDSVQVSHGKPLQHRSDEQIVENRCARAAAPDRRDKAGIRRTSVWSSGGGGASRSHCVPGTLAWSPASAMPSIPTKAGAPPGAWWVVSGETQILEHVRCSTVSQLVPWVFRRQSHSL